MRLEEATIDRTNVNVANVAPLTVNLPSIATPDFGTVTLPQDLLDRWNADGKAIVGWPIADAFTIAPGGGVALYCESGMIVRPPHGKPLIVQGRVYVKYRDLNDVHGWVGLPLADDAASANGGRMSRFANADIYASDATGAHEVHGAIRDQYNAQGGPGGFLGYPLSDELPVMNGGTEVGRFNRFEGGVIYWSAATGAWEVHGAIRDLWENDQKGATGNLGFPVSNETRTGSDSNRYSDFERGVIVFRTSDGALFTFTKLDFFLDGYNTKGSDGFLRGGQDLYVKANVRASSGEGFSGRMPSSGDYGSDEQIAKSEFTVGVMHGGTTIHVLLDGWDSDWPDGDDELGKVDETYSIENLWGINEDASHWRGDFQARYKLRQIVNFDHSKFRENFYWKFHNFDTKELSWGQFAETFSDVSNDESVVWHPFDHLFYSAVYKGVADGGNCFGMCWESLFAQVGRSIYREPIALVPPTDGSRPALPANSEVMNVVNVKHGYQVSGEMVDFVLPRFILGHTHDPKRAFTESRDQFGRGDYPVLALTNKSLSLGGHVVRPYAWDDSQKPWKMYVCDPNHPLVSGDDPHDTFVSVDPDANTFSFQHGANDLWTGGTWSGGRMYSIPFHVACSEPRTPFWEVLALLVGGGLIILGGDATTQQIRDSSGKRFYKDGLAAGPQNWEDLQPDANRIPNMARVPMLSTDAARLLVNSGLEGHLGAIFALAKNPEVYYRTQARPKPGDLTRMVNNANDHLKDLAVNVPPAGAATGDASALRLGLLHSFLAQDPLPAGAIEVQLAQGSGAYSWGVRTPVASHVVNVPAGTASKDSLLLENMGHAQQAMTFAPDGEKAVGIIVVGGSPALGNARSFGIENLGLRAGQKVRTHYDAANGALVVENTGDATALDVTVSAGPGSAAGTKRTAVPLGANSVTRFAPEAWTPTAVATGKIRMETLTAATGAPIATTEI